MFVVACGLRAKRLGLPQSRDYPFTTGVDVTIGIEVVMLVIGMAVANQYLI